MELQMTNHAVSFDDHANARPTQSDAGWVLVFAAWLLATVSTLGALFLSEVSPRNAS